MTPLQPTRATRAGIGTDTSHGAVVPPIHLSANFTFRALGEPREYDYTRSGNPTRDHLARAVAELEGGVGGIITSSGMSAITLITQLLSRGDTVVAPFDCYGGLHRLLLGEGRRVGFDARFLDQTRDEALAETRDLRPRIVWIETPSNPLLRITDIRRWAALAQEIGALCVVDNTFLSPALQRPLALGADIVIHSATKFLNGHSDVVLGAVVTRDTSLQAELEWWANCLGLSGAPFDSYLALRGLRTLEPRLAAHQRNASAVVEALTDHPAVARVHYPGLESHPGHEIALRQQRGFGSLVSVELQGGWEAAQAFTDGLSYFSLAESLGGVESLVAHPASMTHASMTPEARARAGIGDGLIRLSVGIEAEADLVSDVRHALRRAGEAACPVQC